MTRRASDKPTIICTVTPEGLAPSSAYDAEVLGRYAIGCEVEVSIFQPRNQKQSRFFWVILGKVVDNQDVFPNAEALATALKIRIGHFETLKLIGDAVIPIPKSMRSMDQQQFSEFMEQSFHIIATEVIPGLDIDVLLREGRIALGGSK